MKNNSIYSYDKEPQCEYCQYAQGQEQHLRCTLGGEKMPCAHFRYDVFKRIPKHSPMIPEFDKEDFSII